MVKELYPEGIKDKVYGINWFKVGKSRPFPITEVEAGIGRQNDLEGGQYSPAVADCSTENQCWELAQPLPETSVPILG